MSVKSFLEDFKNATKPFPILEEHRNWQDMMEIDVYPVEEEDNTIYLADFTAINGFDKGHGTKGLSFLMNLANKHQVKLVGAVASGRTDEFSDEDLRQWYLDRGWEEDGIEPAEEPNFPDVYKIKYVP